jgi:NAD(P)-dependent dehydrogenase (short-subunit alcohol dehydrogenase family)
MEINGKTFIVTGGGSGLGAATARLLVENGGSVVIADINPAAGQALAGQLAERAQHGRAHFVRTDVTDEASGQQAVEAALARFGPIFGLVNCAGIAIAEKIIGRDGPHDLARFNQVIQINLVGTFNMMRLAATRMAGNEATAGGERGVIINTTSVAALEGQMGQVAYSASKGGVLAMTLPVARDLARHGIRVMAIAPGIFDTPMLAGLPEPARISLGQQVPFPARLGQPSEYAALVKHIIENEMLNGEVIRLDGAIRLAPR